MCDYQRKMYFAKYIQKIFKLCFVFIQEVQITVLSFFSFSLRSVSRRQLFITHVNFPFDGIGERVWLALEWTGDAVSGGRGFMERLNQWSLSFEW